VVFVVWVEMLRIWPTNVSWWRVSTGSVGVKAGIPERLLRRLS
jgi:hypothetical protein